jgi:hypothetical protein
LGDLSGSRIVSTQIDSVIDHSKERIDMGSIRHVFAVIVAFMLSPFIAHAATVYVEWDGPLPGETVQSYNYYLDALPVVSVPVKIDTACTCVKVPITVGPGPHTVKVTAVAPVLVGDTNVVESTPVVVTFTINPGSQIKNVKVVGK